MSNQPQKQDADTRLPYPEDTIFLVPDIEYDKKVITGYLKKKYRNIPNEMITSQVNTHAIPHLTNLKLIVCVRRPAEGEALGLAYTVAPDERNILREKPIAPETYHHEVVESPVIKVTEHVKAPKTTLFASVETNVLPLIDVLAQHAYPCRVTIQNKPDFLLRCVVAA